MNFNDLQNAWNSDGNEPTAVQREKLAKQFAASLRRQRRDQLIWLVWIFFVLTVMTGFVSWIVFGTEKIDLAREWGILLLLLIPWSAAIIFLKRFLKQSDPICRGDVATSDALAAGAAANRAAQSRSKIMGVMYAVFLPVLAYSLWQLYDAGKASPRELISMAIFFGGVLGLCAMGVFVHYRFRLVPRQRHLAALLSQF